VVFVTYNYAGIKEHGTHYIKQFLGPVVFLMPLMFLIETVAHLARPVSLSLRLLGNIFGDHLVLSVFTGLTYVILPSFLLFFGLLVASIQSFVFTLLSSIYISLAISHDH
jgi:F-type H+-transporting ATPase subunit a